MRCVVRFSRRSIPSTSLCRDASSAVGDTEVRVRFAPSPTGRLHLGSLRTALFNYLFARRHGGKFVLRLEDTDRQRYIDGCGAEFERILDDYGLRRDEGPTQSGTYGPYVQSERLNLYREAADQLIAEGKAYRCFCSSERLEILRRTALQNRETPRYDGRCRIISEAEAATRRDEPHVVRFKFDRSPIHFHDINYGVISVDQPEDGDFVLLKSDGFPTYHLANAVDDNKMRISHVIRGMEWLTSTPKHIRLHEALHQLPPAWLHLPLITRDGHHKLSKRDDDAFVDYYNKQMGYLPEAILNFLLRNGSGIKNFDLYHFYSLDEMVENFDERLIGTRTLQMDSFALNSYGRRSIHRAPYEQLFMAIRRFLYAHATECAPECLTDDYLRRALDFLLHNEEDFSHLAQLLKPKRGAKDRFSFLFTKPTAAIHPPHDIGIERTIDALHQISQLSDADFNVRQFKSVATVVGIPSQRLLQLFRSATIDNNAGPPIAEIIEFFGVAECRHRIEEQVQWLSEAHNHSEQRVNE